MHSDEDTTEFFWNVTGTIRRIERALDAKPS